MKITFFKNDTCDNSRTVLASTYYSADAVNIMEPRCGKVVSRIICSISLVLTFAVSLSLRSAFDFIFFFSAFLLILPIHEFIHTFAQWRMKKPVYAIRFFPYGFFRSSKPLAYVKAGICVATKIQYLFFITAPMIFLSVIPLILFVFIPVPSVRFCLLLTALLNISISYFDLCNIIHASRFPPKALYFDSCGWLLQKGEHPIIIRYFISNETGSDVTVSKYRYQNNKMTQVPEEYDDPKVLEAIKSLKERLGRQAETK